MKSALRIYLSVSYVMKSITSISHLRWLFPPLVPPAAKGGIKKWRRRRRTSPVERYFIPPEGGALKPSGRRQPVPDRTLGAQGQRPGGAINPHARKGVSTFGNTGKHRYDPQHPLRSDRLMSLCSREYGPESSVGGQRIADAGQQPQTPPAQDLTISPITPIP